jgi:hypothetical protein
MNQPFLMMNSKKKKGIGKAKQSKGVKPLP